MGTKLKETPNIRNVNSELLPAQKLEKNVRGFSPQLNFTSLIMNFQVLESNLGTNYLQKVWWILLY